MVKLKNPSVVRSPRPLASLHRTMLRRPMGAKFKRVHSQAAFMKLLQICTMRRLGFRNSLAVSSQQSTPRAFSAQSRSMSG
jgi:hypothetical protein